MHEGTEVGRLQRRAGVLIEEIKVRVNALPARVADPAGPDAYELEGLARRVALAARELGRVLDSIAQRGGVNPLAGESGQ